jgi:hypothetical protein
MPLLPSRSSSRPCKAVRSLARAARFTLRFLPTPTRSTQRKCTLSLTASVSVILRRTSVRQEVDHRTSGQQRRQEQQHQQLQRRQRRAAVVAHVLALVVTARHPCQGLAEVLLRKQVQEILDPCGLLVVRRWVVDTHRRHLQRSLGGRLFLNLSRVTLAGIRFGNASGPEQNPVQRTERRRCYQDEAKTTSGLTRVARERESWVIVKVTLTVCTVLTRRLTTTSLTTRVTRRAPQSSSRTLATATALQHRSTPRVRDDTPRRRQRAWVLAVPWHRWVTTKPSDKSTAGAISTTHWNQTNRSGLLHDLMIFIRPAQ